MKNVDLTPKTASFAVINYYQSLFPRIFLAIILCLTLSMCKEHEDLIPPENKVKSLSSKIYHDNLKREFGKVLATVLFEEVGVRKLIREEALKKFNNDFEVLYQMVKDQPLSGGGTLHETLLEHSGNESLLKEIERELPLLTILVPELPQNSFSAETWDVETQLPVVGLRIWSEQGVPILVGNGEDFYLPFDLTPGFPVVVVKDNERVTTTDIADEFTFKAPNSNFYFRFTDGNFNNLEGTITDNNPLARGSVSMHQKIINARNIMDPIDGWQRDHVYYGLTPGNDKGPFSLDFKEKLTSFRFNYGKEAYDKISEQSGDPEYYGIYHSNRNTPPRNGAAWTDGSFEFNVNALVNSKSTGQPAVAPKFYARGYELFDLEYQLIHWSKCKWYQGCFGKDLYVFGIKNVTAKTYLPKRVDLINWDLDKFAPTMIISIKEMDVSETITTKENSSTEFAGNFGIEGDVWKKIGLKFGASAKKVFASERTVVSSLGSDDLGETTVEFGDKVIIREGKFWGAPLYYTREYSTGVVSFSIEPASVQP